jgi:tetratricopeptide (TPR) repeat protein
MYEVREQWELAREVYLKLAKVSPEWKPLVYLRSGMLYEREEKLTETEQMYQKAIQLDKTNPDGYAFLGELLTRSGRADEALQVFRRMAKLGGENAAAAYLYQAALHRQLGQVRMFDKDCRQVIALADLERKPSGILLRRAGLAYLMQGDYPAALQRLALAVKRNKQDAQALFYSSLAAAALEDKRKANSFFKRGLKVSKSVQEFKYPIEEAEILVKRNPQLEAVQMLLDNMVAASH